MGMPIIIWPPGGGNFTDTGDTNNGACQFEMGSSYVDCSNEYESGYFFDGTFAQGELGDSGLACCGSGF